MKKIDPNILTPEEACSKTFECALTTLLRPNQRIAEAERAIMAKQRAAARARQESLERMIGAACMATAQTRPRSGRSRALDKHFTATRTEPFSGKKAGSSRCSSSRQGG